MTTWIYQRWLFIAALLVLATGCTRESSSPASSKQAKSVPTESKSTTGYSKSSADDTPQVEIHPADKSLTVEQYIKAGVPAHDRSWSGDDMARAASVFMGISEKDASQLPRYKSESSGKAFERLTADSNFDMYRDLSLPVDHRFPDAMTYMQAFNQVFMLYFSAFNRDAVGGSELIELSNVQLRMSVVMINLTEEVLPSLDKDDPSFPTRMNGLKQMKGGMASIVAGSLQTLTESHAYRTSDLKRFAGYLEATLPDILPELPDGSQTETLARLESFLDDPKMEDLKPELDSLFAAASSHGKPKLPR